jgi:uncharacterized protein YgbK (DUF1537 family)
MGLRVGVLADDLTGALEVGALFAASGICAAVTTRLEWVEDTPISVVDTETRHLTPEAARDVVVRLAGLARERGFALIYKKTDSTLRGNIGAELAGLASAFPRSTVTYVPAYPGMGRTIRGGHLLVDGVPVHLTDFARDPLNPVRDSHVPGLIGLDCIRVVDAETDDDVSHAAEALLRGGPPWLAAGPAALAEAIARRVDVPRNSSRPFPLVRRCLVINGSLHPRSAQQAAAMEPDDEWEVVKNGGPGVERQVLERVGRFDAIAVFGGDTAFTVLRALGCSTLLPLGEVVPGVPVSVVPLARRELTFITKAGGFGPADILASIRNRLGSVRS